MDWLPSSSPSIPGGSQDGRQCIQLERSTVRAYAIDHSLKIIDIADLLGTDLIVL
jgi:hypothetical protein